MYLPSLRIQCVHAALLCFWAAFACSASHAGGLDASTLDRLEVASAREQLNVARDIEAKLRQGRPEPEIQLRLARLIVESENLSRPEYAAVLRALGPGDALTAPTITTLASSLPRRGVQSTVCLEVIGELLRSYDSSLRLPDAAMVAVRDAITPPNQVNPLPAMAVLRVIPVADDRFEKNLATMVAALNGDYPYVREAAIDVLAHYGAQSPLPPAAMAALARSALRDSHIHVRLHAHGALLDQQGADLSGLALAISDELIHPTTAVWSASIGFDGVGNLRARAIALMMQSVEPPYPVRVVDALISQTPSQHSTTLPYLQQVQQAHALTAAQRADLEQVARAHRLPSVRQSVYALLQGAALDESIAQVLTTMQKAPTVAARLEAGYRIERHLGDRPSPRAVAEVAERLLLAAEDAELRGIAARLVVKGPEAVAEREAKLLRALKTHPNDDATRLAWFGLYGSAQLQLLVSRYAADESLAPWIRVMAVHELGELARSDQKLDEAARDSLLEAGQRTDSYALNATVIHALRAWQEAVPWSVLVRSRSWQSQALFVVYAVLVLLFVGGSLVNLIRAWTQPGAGNRSGRRVLRLVGWSLVSCTGLAFFAVALIGFIGHNREPAPVATLKLNLPLYAWMLLFLIGTWVFWFRARRQRLRMAETRT